MVDFSEAHALDLSALLKGLEKIREIKTGDVLSTFAVLVGQLRGFYNDRILKFSSSPSDLVFAQ